MCSSGSNTKVTNQSQSSTTTPDQQALDAYRSLLAQAQGVASTGWNPNTAQQVAGFTPDQMNAFNQVRGGIAAPFINSAYNFATAGAGPAVSGISQYMNPWTNNVVNTTQADFDRSNARQISAVTGDARMRGSLGGDREQVAKALTAREQASVQNPIIAKLRAEGYNSALGAAQNDAGRALQGAGIMGSLAPVAYTDTNALMGIGGQQQQLGQAQLDAATANATAQSAYPFQTTQWLAGILGSATPNMGSTTNSSGTSTTQGPTPNTWSQIAGLGIAALPYLRHGGRVDRAAGGGIGYVPQIGEMPGGRGIQTHAPMSFADGSGGTQQQKGFADHWKEINDTAKSASAGFKGIGDAANAAGKWMNSSTTPGGWNTTVDHGSAMANLSAGISSVLGFATGGGVERLRHRDGGGGIDFGRMLAWNDTDDPSSGIAGPPRPVPVPVVKVPSPAPAAAPLPAVASDDYPGDLGGTYDVPGGATSPPLNVPLMQIARMRPAGTTMIDGSYAQPSSLAPMGEVRVPERGIVGDAYAPPAPPLAPPAAAPPAAEAKPGFFQQLADRFTNWIGSEDARNTLTPMGLAMMAASREGGKGSFGVHFGIGGMEGLKSQAAYREGERKHQIEREKMKLAERAQQIHDAQNTRAEAMHPYDINAKKAEIALREAQATAGKYVPFKSDQGLIDSKTGKIIRDPNTSGNFERAWMEKEAPKRYVEVGTAAKEASDAVSTVEDLKALAPAASLGYGAEWVNAARKLGERLGLDVGSSKIGPTELFQALSQKFVLQSASNLKPLSNSDVEFLQKGFATIAKSPETIKDLLPSMEAAARRLQMQADLELKSIKSEKVPDYRAIIEQSQKAYPSPIVEKYGKPPEPAAPQGGIAPSGAATAQTQRPAITEAQRQELLAVPDDSLVLFGGKPHIKKGNALVPAPEGSYRKGFFGSLGTLDGDRIPSFPRAPGDPAPPSPQPRGIAPSASSVPDAIPGFGPTPGGIAAKPTPVPTPAVATAPAQPPQSGIATPVATPAAPPPTAPSPPKSGTSMLGDDDDKGSFANLNTGISKQDHQKMMDGFAKINSPLAAVAMDPQTLKRAREFSNVIMNADPPFKDGYELLTWKESGTVKSGWFPPNTYEKYKSSSYDPDKKDVSVFFNQGTADDPKPYMRKMR